MTGSTLNYANMLQDAFIGVVRSALAEVAAHGLPGAHHFYISFRTDRDDVEIDDFLRQRYPEVMTIVLQHQFWDLKVADDRFSVLLSFNDTPSKLSVPFAALTAFADPSVEFGLQFGDQAGVATGRPADGSDIRTGDGATVVVGRIDGNGGSAAERQGEGAPAAASGPTPGERRADNSVRAAPSRQKNDGGDDEGASPGSARVVALDKFRKKK